jgi:cytochrome c oxidase subunit 2
MPRLMALLAAAAVAALAGTALAAGSPAAGKKVYAANGCGGCHTFKAAKSTGKIGPALTKARLVADAKRAKQPLQAFVRTSIVKPNAFVPKGFKKGVMPSFAKLTKKQLDDLVAFVAKG